MMNILEQEDIIKGLPDQALMQEAQMPSGQVPQFLVVSEIQRRSDMRKRFQKEQPQEGTVKDRIVGEAGMGIMGAMPPQMAMAPQMPQRMPQMPPQGIEQAMPPQMMSGGGIVRMANGGFLDEVVVKAPNLSDQKLEELIIDGVPTVDLIQMGFTADDISRVGSQVEPRMIREARKAGSYIADMASPVTSLIPDMPSSSVLDPDRADQIVQRGRQRRDQQIADAKASFMGRTDIPPVGAPKGDPFEYNFRISGLPETGGRSPILDPLMSGIGAAYNYMFGDDESPAPQKRLDGETGLPVGEGRGNEVATVSEQTLGPLTIDGDSTEILDASNSGIATADPTREASKDKAGGVNTAGDGREVQSDSVFSTDDYRSRLEYLMSLGVDSDKVEIPTLDYSDIRDDLNRRVQSNMLLALGAGIAGGDVSKGIQAASKVSQAGGRDISKIDLAERQGQFEAATAAQKRQDDLLKTQRMLGAELMGLSDKLRLDKSVNKRAIINYYAKIREGLQDELVALSQFQGSLSPESAALMKQIDRMLQDLGKEYGIELPEIDDGGTNDPAGIQGGGSLGLPLPSRQTAP